MRYKYWAGLTINNLLALSEPCPVKEIFCNAESPPPPQYTQTKINSRKIEGATSNPRPSKNQEELSPCGVCKSVVTGHSNEKPYMSRCGPAEVMFFRCGLCQVRLFCKGLLCSRGQYLRVLADGPRWGDGLCDVAAEAVNTQEFSFLYWAPLELCTA